MRPGTAGLIVAYRMPLPALSVQPFGSVHFTAAPPEGSGASRGYDVAVKYGCFNCHGAEGRGTAPNPRSFKGYIPGFWGADFEELVRDDEELQRWIEKGDIARISGHPIGGWFFSRQAIKMPAFERFLAPEDTEALMAYVRWVHTGAWRPLIR